VKLDLLLDTHIVIWMATAPKRIPKRLLAAIESAGKRFVSHATALEIQLKHLKNEKFFPFSLAHLERVMKEFACTELPITYNDIRAIGHMKPLHQDPFDRVLMAQASNRNIYLATLDQDILRYFHKDKAFYVFADRAMQE
jgi:PIN domain nuclease of toxin-antitoxin system